MLPPCPRLTVPPGCPTSVGLIVMLLPSSCSPPFITAADACPAVIALSPASWSHSWLLLPSLLTPVPLLHFVLFRAVFLLVYDIFFYSPPWGLSLPQTFTLLCWLHLLGLGWRTLTAGFPGWSWNLAHSLNRLILPPSSNSEEPLFRGQAGAKTTPYQVS